jgi:hypothetical protein
MNKKTFLIVVLVLIVIFNFSFVNAETTNSPCQSGDIFNRVTGVLCSNTNGTPAGISGNMSITATPVTFANGKWTYNFTWNRARDAQGTFIVTPVSSPTTITLKVDPAVRNNSSIPATAQLDPSTAYLAEYYNLPQCSKTDIDCVVIASATFTTLSSTGTAPTTTSNNNNGNNSNSSEISSLQAQINALTAQIAQLIALIAGNGITPVVTSPAGVTTQSTTPINSNTADIFNGATITTSATLPAGTVGRSYQNGSFKMIVTCPTSNIFQWVVIEGSLPGGMRLALTGELTGTPTTPGTFVFRA